MKKGVIGLLILVTLINFASAQNMLSDFLNTFDESMIILSAIFIVSFAIVFFALSKVLFKQNVAIAGIVAGVLAFLITYGINKTGFDFEGLFAGIGISSNVLMTIVPLMIIIGAIFLIIKLKKDSLFIFGGLLIVLSFFVYAKAVLIIIAIVLIILGFVLPKKNKGQTIVIKK